MNVAIAEDKVTVVKVVAPSLNVTLPVGTPAYCGYTFAVIVTEWPRIEGFAELASETWLAALATTRVKATVCGLK